MEDSSPSSPSSSPPPPPSSPPPPPPRSPPPRGGASEISPPPSPRDGGATVVSAPSGVSAPKHSIWPSDLMAHSPSSPADFDDSWEDPTLTSSPPVATALGTRHATRRRGGWRATRARPASGGRASAGDADFARAEGRFRARIVNLKGAAPASAADGATARIASAEGGERVLGRFWARDVRCREARRRRAPEEGHVRSRVLRNGLLWELPRRGARRIPAARPPAPPEVT